MMYTIYAQEDVSRFEEDGEDAFVDLNEALEMIRQLKEDQPDLYRRIAGLRAGVRCGYRMRRLRATCSGRSWCWRTSSAGR